jgi:hypothetical protein
LGLWLSLISGAAHAGTVQFNPALTGTNPYSGPFWTSVNWNNPVTWAGGVVPGPADDVILTAGPAPGTLTVVSFAGSTTSVNSLTVGQPSGMMELDISQATLTAGSETVGANGNLYLSGGGSNIVTGALQVGNNPAASSYLTIGYGGGPLFANTIQVNSGAQFTVEYDTPALSYQTLTNDGSLFTYDGVTINSGGATLTNENSGAAVIAQDQGGPAAFVNTGPGTTLNNTAGAQLVVGSILDNQNGAVLYNSNGGLLFNGAGARGGVLPVLTGREVVAYTDPNGAIYNSAYLVNYGTGTNLYSQNGSLLVNDGASAVVANIATITNAASQFTNQGGAMVNNSGTFYNQAGYNWELAAQSPATLTNTGADPNTGAVSNFNNYYGGTVTNTGWLTTINNVNGATFTNNAGTLNNLAGAYIINSDPTTQFYNQYGATLINDGGGAAALHGTYINNESGATFTNRTGALLFNQNNGQFVNSGGNVFNQSGAAFTNQTGASIVNENAGAFTNDNATLTLSNTAVLLNTGANTKFYNQNGAALYNTGGGLGVPPLIDNTAGATFTNQTGAFLYNQNGGQMTNDGPGTNFVNQSGATFTNSDTGTLFSNINGATLTNSGGATLLNTNFAELQNDTASTLINATGGILTNDTTANMINDGAFQNSGTVNDYGWLTGIGTYTQTGGSTTVTGTFDQGSLDIEGGTFTDSGAVSIAGSVTNSGSIFIDGVTMWVPGAYSSLNGVTLLNGGNLDPSSIDINGGVFGGTGQVNGDITLTNATLQVGTASDPAGQLTLNNNYYQLGGEIEFEVSLDGNGDFQESTLVFNPGYSIYMSGVDFIFDFEDGADPYAFSNDGLFNITSFLLMSDSSDLLSACPNLRGNFFTLDIGGTPSNQLYLDTFGVDLQIGPAITAPTPEPGTLFPILAVLGLAWRRRSAPGAAKR